MEPDYLGSGLLIKRAIKKYGKENFTRIILRFCRTKNSLNNWENKTIKRTPECLSSNGGYNIATRWFGGDTFHNHPRKEELRKVRSKVSKKLWKNPETRKAITEKNSIAKMGNSYVKGYHFYTDGKTNKMARRCPVGFWKGRTLKLSKESRKLRSDIAKRINANITKKQRKDITERTRITWQKNKHKHKSSKGMTFYTNGTDNVRAFKKPRGKEWYKGRTFNAHKQKGLIWWNNGSIQTRAFKRPRGFKKGRLR